MEAIVLAGGIGTRLRPVLPNLPKPMAPVGGRPFLEILFSNLAATGFKRVVLSLGHMADQIIEHFGNSFNGLEIVPIIESQPLGTGGAVRLAIQHVLNDHAFIFNGDTFLELTASDVESLWQRLHLPVIVGCTVADTTRYGRLIVNDGYVSGFTEKGVSGPGLINAGTYLLPKNLLNSFLPGMPFSLERDVLVPLVSRQSVSAFVTSGLFIDIGVPEDYLRAQTLLVSRYP